MQALPTLWDSVDVRDLSCAPDERNPDKAKILSDIEADRFEFEGTIIELIADEFAYVQLKEGVCHSSTDAQTRGLIIVDLRRVVGFTRV